MFNSKLIQCTILVSIFFFLLLTACGSSITATSTIVIPTGIPPPTNTAFPIKAPSEIPAVTVTSSASYLKFPSAHCCKGVSLDAGRYEMPSWFGIPVTVEVGDGWKALNEDDALLFLIGRGLNIQNNPNQIITFMNVSDKTTPEALILSVQRAPELIIVSEPISVIISGFPGLQLDSAAKPNPSYEGDKEADIPPGVQFLPVFMKYFTPGFLWTTSSADAQIRTIILTVRDQTLLLYLEAPPNEFDQFVTDADAILRSLELIKNK